TDGRRNSLVVAAQGTPRWSSLQASASNRALHRRLRKSTGAFGDRTRWGNAWLRERGGVRPKTRCVHACTGLACRALHQRGHIQELGRCALRDPRAFAGFVSALTQWWSPGGPLHRFAVPLPPLLRNGGGNRIFLPREAAGELAPHFVAG